MVCDQLVPEHLHPDPLAVSRWNGTASTGQPSRPTWVVAHRRGRGIWPGRS